MLRVAPLLVLLGCKPDAAPAAPDEPPAPAKETTPATTVPEGPCVGGESGLNLASLGHQDCVTDGDELAAPVGSLRTHLSPAPLDMPGDGRGELTAYMVNVTDGPITFDAWLGCDPWTGVTLAGDGVSFVPGSVVDDTFAPYCGRAARCGRGRTRITLQPGGKAFIPFTIDARAREFDETRRLVDSPPLAAGSYVVNATLPVENAPPASGVLRVK